MQILKDECAFQHRINWEVGASNRRYFATFDETDYDKFTKKVSFIMYSRQFTFIFSSDFRNIVSKKNDLFLGVGLKKQYNIACCFKVTKSILVSLLLQFCILF